MLQLQEGDTVEVLGKKFIVLKIVSEQEFTTGDGAPIHTWIERLELMEVRDDRKAS